MIESIVMTDNPDGTVTFDMVVDEETMQNLRRLQDLLRDEIPDGDIGKIMELALEAAVNEMKQPSNS